MKNIKTVIALLLATVMCFALLAGCASKEASPETNTPEGEVNDNQTDDSVVDDLAYIKDKGKMVIGYTPYQPMNYNDDNGEFTGFDTEFAIAVCKKLGIEPEFVNINWETKEVELNAKSIDCIWNGLTIDEDRKTNMSITVPYVKNAQIIVVKADSDVSSTADLVGKTVVAEIGSAGEILIKGKGKVKPEENLAKANYIGMNKQTDCLLELKSGTADAAVLDWTLAKTATGKGTNYEDLKIVEDVELNSEEYGVAFRKGSNLTEAVNKIIEELVEDGTLPALAEKYGLSLAPSIAQ